MKFENPDVANDVNVSDEHPLKEFMQLLVGVVVIAAILLLVLHFSIQYLVKYIPFSYEVEVVSEINLLNSQVEGLSENAKAKQVRLQSLVDDLVKGMQVSDEIDIVVHYSDQPLVNAFATLGGHIFIYQGLLDQLKSEQALTMVLAHEIAHIQLRHPIASLAKSVTLISFAGLITGATGSDAGELLISSSTHMGMLTFSREQERQSDFLAAKTIQAHYGNIAGAKDLFSTFENLQKNNARVPVIFSSHPHSDSRWDVLLEKAPNEGWIIDGQLNDISWR